MLSELTYNARTETFYSQNGLKLLSPVVIKTFQIKHKNPHGLDPYPFAARTIFFT